MEKSLQELQSSYTNGLWILTFIFSILFLVRLYLVVKSRKDRKWLFHWKGEWFVYGLKFIFLIAMVSLLVGLPTWFYYIAGFRILINDTAIHSFVLVWYLIAIQEIILSFTASKRLVEQFIKRMLFFLLSIFWVLGFGLASLIVFKAYDYPSKNDCVSLSIPVHGTWRASHAGGHSSVNYHLAIPQQAYAIDLLKVNDDGNFFTGTGTAITDYICLNDSVFSPVNGKIAFVIDSFNNEQVLKKGDTINPLGNYIAIEIAKEKFVILAQLNKGSIKVKQGDEVKAGDHLAQVGNSGNTTWPHLHMQVSNKADVYANDAIGLPFVFKNYCRKRWWNWSSVESDYLMRNDFISSTCNSK
ncbi:MAG: M23 family metallopeptidase [Bacteroidia bacterium]